VLPNARLLAEPGPRSSSRVAPPRAGRCRVITDDRFRGWSRCDGDSHLGTGPAADRSARLIMWLRMRSGYRLAGPPLRLRSAMRARRASMRSRSARCRGMVSPTAAVPHRERVLPRREERIELRAHKRGGVISALAGSTGASGRHRRLRVRPRPGRSGAPDSARSWDPRASFSWGIPGVGAQELAWAVIRDATGDSRLADDWCADLSGEIVSRLPLDEFWLRAFDIVAWLDASPVASAIGLRAPHDSCERAAPPSPRRRRRC
jgi:hypothetical protein